MGKGREKRRRRARKSLKKQELVSKATPKTKQEEIPKALPKMKVSQKAQRASKSKQSHP